MEIAGAGPQLWDLQIEPAEPGVEAAVAIAIALRFVGIHRELMMAAAR